MLTTIRIFFTSICPGRDRNFRYANEPILSTILEDTGHRSWRVLFLRHCVYVHNIKHFLLISSAM